MFDFDFRAKFAVKKLNDNGFPSFFVGGCVRDSILGRKIFDYDITTKATPYEVKKIFSDCNVIETGIKHGTVTVIFDGLPLEITTFRSDGEYIDNRHPNTVRFSERVEDDLSRRDFTMNALAVNSDGKVVDLFCGKSDIENRVIRCVGNPDKRFSEDALRILRCLRFSSELDFEIEDKTKLAIFQNAELLKNISNERIYTEFSKLLCGKNFEYVLKEYKVVFDVVFKDFVLPSNLGRMNAFSSHLLLKYAYLFEKSKFRKENIEFLKMPNKDKFIIYSVWDMNENKFELNKVSVKYLLNKYGKECVEKYLLYLPEKLSIKAFLLYNSVIQNNECYSIEQLSINGNDLLNSDIEKKNIGKVLKNILDAVISEKIPNNKEDIIKYINNSEDFN